MSKAAARGLSERKPDIALIIKELEKISSSGNRQHQIFTDWLDMVEATMAMQGQVIRALIRNEPPPEDPPETQQLWERLRVRYRQTEYFTHFAHAYAQLVACTDRYQDILGAIYMQFGNPNPNSGQFFTPYEVSKLIGMMLADADAAPWWPVVEAAIDRDPFAQEVYSGCAGLDDDLQQAWMCALVIPLIMDKIEHIKVMEPAIGSGGMVLALAEQYPEWVVKMGIVQFYGIDIDPLCVQMSRIHFRLYGLNGYGCGDVLMEAELKLLAMPEPDRARFIQYKERVERHIALELSGLGKMVEAFSEAMALVKEMA